MATSRVAHSNFVASANDPDRKVAWQSCGMSALFLSATAGITYYATRPREVPWNVVQKFGLGFSALMFAGLGITGAVVSYKLFKKSDPDRCKKLFDSVEAPEVRKNKKALYFGVIGTVCLIASAALTYYERVQRHTNKVERTDIQKIGIGTGLVSLAVFGIISLVAAHITFNNLTDHKKESRNKDFSTLISIVSLVAAVALFYYAKLPKNAEWTDGRKFAAGLGTSLLLFGSGIFDG